MNPSGSKRGYGACSSCKKEYSNRSKTEYCSCGNYLGGKFLKISKELIPSSVNLWNQDNSYIRSVRVTPNDDRNFVYVSGDEKICHVKKCLEIRSSFLASGKIETYSCEHLDKSPCEPKYTTSFLQNEIEDFTPDEIIQRNMIQTQEEGFDSVIKVSPKSYAVKSMVSTSSPLGYVHVMVEKGSVASGGVVTLKCKSNSCKKKTGNTKNVKERRRCIHIHFVMLARKLKEDIRYSTSDPSPHSNHNSSLNLARTQTSADHVKSTIDLYLNQKIPYHVPHQLVKKADEFMATKIGRICFEPQISHCELCHSSLGESKYPQGCNSLFGNGTLISNTTPFLKVDIKIRKCSKKECKAVVGPVLFNEGFFNVSNKVVVSIDVLLEWREFFKDGMPISNIIRRKLKSLMLKVEDRIKPTENELQYLVSILYDGFYAFEALTERNLDDAICGECGIIGKAYYGDGNEKNCCTNRNILLESNKSESLVSGNENESNIENFLLNIRKNLLQRMLFPNTNCTFTASISNIPPIIPPSQRIHQYNTEADKKSVYLQGSMKDVEGDAMKLSYYLKENKISISDLDSMDLNQLQILATETSVSIRQNSKDMLKLKLKQLYSTILVGTSACHEFVKSPGHTGGFYHIVCPHGTTVCSKLMILTESVRDAADLWLSLKYPPVMFICDTPCTLVQHINNRSPDLAEEYWSEFNGCFEKPTTEKKPSVNMNVPSIVPTQFQNKSVVYEEDNTFKHPLTGQSRRYICGDRFHTSSNPHKSDLCKYHDIDLCCQSATLKTSYQESINNRKNKTRNRSSCTQDILHHYFYNYLMTFYENEEIVLMQKRNLELCTKKSVTRDEFKRFVV